MAIICDPMVGFDLFKWIAKNYDFDVNIIYKAIIKTQTTQD